MLKRSKGPKAKCDVLFSKIIRHPGYCLKCGSREQLQCAHIISRRYSATRTDLRNAYCLCAADHFYFTTWPREFSRFVTEHTGSEVYDELKAKAETPTKVDWSQELIRLQALYEHIDD